MQADISVIIPTWNRARDVKLAVESVLNQTLLPREILVCDDGSEDDTEAVVSGISSEILSYISLPHIGNPAAPRNQGIEKAKGKWLAFLDSDDIWKADKLEKQYNALKRNSCFACCSNAELKNDPTKKLLLPGETTPRLIDFTSLLNGNMIVCSSVFLDRDLAIKAGLFPVDMKFKGLEDYALWLRVALLSDFYLLPEPLVVYNDDINQSTARSIDQNTWQQMHIVIDYALESDAFRGFNKIKNGRVYVKLTTRKFKVDKELVKYENSTHR